MTYTAAIDDSTGYVAIGHRVPDSDPHRDLSAYFMESEVMADLEARGITFLGHQVHDSEYWQSSGPMYRFESYIGSETMPRNLVISGPHPFLDCECLVCGPRNAAFEDARQKQKMSEA